MVEIKPFNPEQTQKLVETLALAPMLGEIVPSERSMGVVATALADYYRSILSAVENGKPIVLQQLCVGPELFYAFDVQPVNPEAWAAVPLLTNPEMAVPYLEIAENAGVAADLCSVNRTMIGELIGGSIPRPDFITWASQPCDSIKVGYYIAKYLTGVPMFFIDSPQWDTPECLDYYAHQVRQLIVFLEEQTGRKLDWDRLKEVVEESNRAVEYIIELNELRKLVPCPSDSRVPTYLFITFMTMLGLPGATAMYKAFRDEAKERAQKKEGVVPEEKIRGIWFSIMVPWDLFWQNWLQEELGHVNVMDMFGYLTALPIDTSTPDKLIRGLAERWHMAVPMGRQARGIVDSYFNDFLYVYEEWKGDCLILAGNSGCRWLKGAYGMLREICREREIPALQFDIDIFDPRFVSAQAYRGQVEDFLTTVVMPAKAAKKR
jgi:benzoyl-CoA reductase/2-hydroxyglutaryl-CoA dehydratase subunit BcrC/BadD/HgdB